MPRPEYTFLQPSYHPGTANSALLPGMIRLLALLSLPAAHAHTHTTSPRTHSTTHTLYRTQTTHHTPHPQFQDKNQLTKGTIFSKVCPRALLLISKPKGCAQSNQKARKESELIDANRAAVAQADAARAAKIVAAATVRREAS